MGAFRYTRRTYVREVALMITAVIFCIPLYLLISISLKTSSQVYTSPLSLPLHPHFSNYASAWSKSGNPGIGRAMRNSAIITAGSVALVIGVGSLAAYVLVRRGSKLATSLYILFLVGIILPFQLAIIPVYVQMRNLHLTGTYLGAIVLYAGLLTPLTVFLYAGFIRTLPREYEEAAQVDGAGQIRTFLRVVFPLLRPITATVALLAALLVWNDFFLSLVYLSGSKNATLPVAVYSFAGEYLSQWQLLYAGVAISIAPMILFFLVAQKQFIRGFSGGLKG